MKVLELEGVPRVPVFGPAKRINNMYTVYKLSNPNN
jgi:hypothetical protein